MTFVAGASASIMKTISEIEAILEGENLDYGGPKREVLRAKLQGPEDHPYLSRQDQ